MGLVQERFSLGAVQEGFVSVPNENIFSRSYWAPSEHVI